MKKYFLILLMGTVLPNQSFSCGGDYDVNNDYYNLFMQEIINDPRYYPFLLTLGSAFNEENESVYLKNENIEEWQQYLGLNYDDAYYLVFKASEADLRKLIAGKSVSGKQLGFATATFVQKHKQALLYLAYAKYLEPYMSISKSPVSNDSGWRYYDSEYDKTASELDYKKVMNVLKQSWKAEADNELKLRYGYQMVRFAHYNLKYAEAIDLFNIFVESLNFKPAMYYYALNQKAGADRGLGDFSAAYSNYLQVLVHSTDLKKNVFNSLRLGGEIPDYETLVNSAKTTEEKNDVYLFLGFISYSNPLNEIEKIVVQSPNAIQAKVLMARAVNLIERDRLPVWIYFQHNYYSDDKSVEKLKDKRYPLIETGTAEMNTFFANTLKLATKMIQRSDVKDKNFWYLTAAYLQFLKRDYATAKILLDKVKEVDEKYTSQKKTLAMLIDISSQPKITNKVEIKLYTQYKELFQQKPKDSYMLNNTTLDFVLDVLANRYFLQKDFAKSFLLNNDIQEIQRNPQMELLNDIEVFFKKGKKNVFEQYIVSRMNYKNDSQIQDFINSTWGIIYLTHADLEKALKSFEKVNTFDDYLSVFNSILGYNRIECFNCEEDNVMAVDYVADFPFISKEKMNPKELMEVLLKLKKIGTQSNEQSAKANYLIGNFFYNVSETGYYRNYTRFSSSNGYSYSIYSSSKKPDIYDNIYFKYYQHYYDNSNKVSEEYLGKAYNLAVDKELKARIIFALSKCEQEDVYMMNAKRDYDDSEYGNSYQYFKELKSYKGTHFYNEVKSNCNYFNYYVSNF